MVSLGIKNGYHMLVTLRGRLGSLPTDHDFLTLLHEMFEATGLVDTPGVRFVDIYLSDA